MNAPFVFQRSSVFTRAAPFYHQAAALPHEVANRLLGSLEYLDDRIPARVLDVGSGTGYASGLIKKRWPSSQVIALDCNLAMLYQGKKRRSWWRPFQQVCADASALPLADQSVDLLFCNLTLPWLGGLSSVLAEFRRVLAPEGLLLCSSFGPETLQELGMVWSSQAVDTPVMASAISIAELGDSLMSVGFSNPVLDRELLTLTYDSFPTLLRELRALGMSRGLHGSSVGLVGRQRFAQAQQAYEQLRGADGKLPSSWDIVYAHAWAPKAGTPVRTNDLEMASVPIAGIPIRRRIKSE